MKAVYNNFLIVLLIALLCSTKVQGQERIEGVMAFQFNGDTDPAKKYSIYIPSTYVAGSANPLMLGLHPFNTNRWNSTSWCDTLITFAETNGLLLLCPDGGPDGRVDDPIDTAFTSVLLDSMALWYNVDAQKIFAIGFSWGGLTTYTYGLNHVEQFAGFIPIGAAISGTQPIANVLENSKCKPYYIIHGSLDNPGIRFFPLRDSLIVHNACVETNYLIGVGHTIDFPNRNQILTDAFIWLDSISCELMTEVVALPQMSEHISVFPTTIRANMESRLHFTTDGHLPGSIVLINMAGRKTHVIDYDHDTVQLPPCISGIHWLVFRLREKEQIIPIVILP